MTDGNSPAPAGIFPEPPACVIFALRVDIHMQQIDPIPPGGNLHRVGLNEGKPIIRHIMALKRVVLAGAQNQPVMGA